ncbi:MAG: hypothetical protein IJF92_05425 [Bacilli bacterium]|nr:hypothetical protein [Bacilli bacterium]
MKKKTKIIYICIYSVLVLVILIFVIKLCILSRERAHKKLSNIVVPVIRMNDNINFNILVDKMGKDDEYNYYIKISNFRKNKINKKDINYNIEFISDSELSLSLYKYKSKNNLLNDDLKVENLKINGGNKASDIYVVRIRANKKIENKQIKVKITT